MQVTQYSKYIESLPIGSEIEIEGKHRIYSIKVTCSRIKKKTGFCYKVFPTEESDSVTVQVCECDDRISWTDLMRDLEGGSSIPVLVDDDKEIKKARATASSLNALGGGIWKVTNQKQLLTITRTK